MTGPRYCWRCDQPITTGQTAQTVAKDSLSAGGANIELHEKCAKRPAYTRRHQLPAPIRYRSGWPL
ncbi:hypothetical protein [Streptomyces sp. NPDC020607]|uniref:hypothetical protein n=1 Tax=Streptomyces sp. NPDC020607 TaxID=3365082 RepID=UPI00379739AB